MQGFKRLEMVIRGSVIGSKINGFISCKINFCPYYFTVWDLVGKWLGNYVILKGYEDTTSMDASVFSDGVIVGW